MPNTNSNAHSSGNRITPARLNVIRPAATGATSNGSLPTGGGGKFVTLTQAEYTALPTKDPDVVYLIQQ